MFVYFISSGILQKCTVRSTFPNLLLIVKDVGMLLGKPLNLLFHSLPYHVSS